MTFSGRCGLTQSRIYDAEKDEMQHDAKAMRFSHAEVACWHDFDHRMRRARSF
jgi:hypothetical protein